MSVPILVYHKVDDSFEWGLTRVTTKAFRRQIEILLDRGYELTTLSGLESAEQTEKVAAITFDDAYESVYSNAFPILKEYGFPATIFVISSFVGKENLWDVNVGNILFKHATWEQLSELVSAGWEVGSHTVSHLNLRGLSTKDMRIELEMSREKLERNLSTPVRYVSYPFGRVNRSVLMTALDVGYEGGVIFYPVFRRIPPDLSSFMLKRLGVYLWDTDLFFKGKLEGHLLKPFEILKQNLINACSGATILMQNMR